MGESTGDPEEAEEEAEASEVSILQREVLYSL